MNKTIIVRMQLAAGVEWLDDTVPNWRSRINTDTLAMSDGTQCIAGQLFAHLDSTGNGVGYDAVYDAFGASWCVDHGFAGPFDLMRQAWVEELA